ncbi:MAG: hypothetical protein M1833_001962 [Piccolia ochrophora]|nr:MAG: hypothetical protein M1833_001962 [Piccolia ochrophora]
MSQFATYNYQNGACLNVQHSADKLLSPGALPWDPINWPVIAGLTGLGYMISLELLFRVIYTLKDLKGLYFWSLIVGVSGCIIHITGSMVKFFVDGVPPLAAISIIAIGWWTMVPGQALVLYSRLHLVVEDKIVLWGVRILIATTCGVFLTVCGSFSFLTNSVHGERWAKTWEVGEKTQITGFFISETTLSIIYIICTWRVLQTSAVIRVRRVIWFLVLTNLVIIALDVLVLSMQMVDWYVIQATLKPCVYAIKFKLEFAFLNQLLFITTHGFAFVRDPRKSPVDMKPLRDHSASGPMAAGGSMQKASSNDTSSTSRENGTLEKGNTTPDSSMAPPYINHDDDTRRAPRNYGDDIQQAVERRYQKESDVEVPGESFLDFDSTPGRPSAPHLAWGHDRRRSVENLGGDDDDKLRRAEIGLHDFAYRH